VSSSSSEIEETKVGNDSNVGINNNNNNNLRHSRLKKERIFPLSNIQCEKLQEENNLLITTLEKQFKKVEAFFYYNDECKKIIIRGDNLDNERILQLLQSSIGMTFTEAEFQRLVDDLTSLEYNRKQMLSNPSQTLTNFFTIINKGVQFIKHYQNGPSRKEWFLIENDRLFWKDNEKSSNHTNRSLEIKSITKIIPGKQTSILKQERFDNIEENKCFSIISIRSNKTIDFECFTREMRDEWLTYVQFIYTHYFHARRRTIVLKNNENILDELIEDID